MINHNPSIVTNGLVMLYDSANIKSYKGPPIQNLMTTITPNPVTGTGFDISSGSEIVNVPQLGSQTVKYVLIQNNYPAVSAQCCPAPMSYGSFAVTPSTLYTYAIVYKCDSGYTSPNYMYRYEYTANGGTYVTEAGVHNTTNRTHLGNGWYWAWGTFTTSATTNWLTGLNSFYYQYSTNYDKLSVAKILLVKGDYTALHPKYWPDVNVNRPNTLSVFDLTGLNYFTASNLVYSNNGTMSFNGTNSMLSVGTLPNQFLTTGITISLGWYYSAATTNDNVFSWGFGAFNAGAVDAIELRIRGSGSNLEFAPHTISQGVVASTRTSYSPATNFNGRNSFIDVTYQPNYAATVYENGTSVLTQAYAIGTGTSTAAIQLGHGSDSYFPGKILFARIYNRALFADEIAQNFNAIRGLYGV